MSEGDPMKQFDRRDFLKSSAAAALAGSSSFGVLSRALAADPINFFAWSAGVDQVKSHISAFEAKTGLKVAYANAPWAQYRDTLVTKFVGGAPLDVLWVSDSWLPEWAEAGWLAPIDGYRELTKYNAEVDDFSTKSMTYKGKQYGLTYYTDYMGFFYDEQMLKKAGISAPPKTWDEVVQQSLKIKKAGLSEYPMMLSMARETWLIEFISAMVFSHGGRLVDDTGVAVMDDRRKGAREALTWVVDAVNKHKIVSPACVEIGELNGLKAFSSGQHAFAMLGRYRVRTLNDPKQSQIAGRVKQGLMPAGPNGSHATVGWNRFYGLTASAAKNKAKAADAVKFIEWFGGKADGKYAFQKLMFMDVGAGFAVKPLFKDPEIIKTYSQYSDIKMYERQQALARKKDVVSPWFGEWDEVNGTAWQAAILGKSSVNDALKRSADTWNKLRRRS
ncbi:MAG: sugar ABC transporter substrate-binding protein [Betaproteobacteria bacterium RIFCSPLOWO2_12_FULL_68_19]|nr:MAG: sugar ABC transporter substrate-binding protein [Betaproteobacteria bacterium RIFCSPLOWO2_12_FULL_68_19]